MSYRGRAQTVDRAPRGARSSSYDYSSAGRQRRTASLPPAAAPTAPPPRVPRAPPPFVEPVAAWTGTDAGGAPLCPMEGHHTWNAQPPPPALEGSWAAAAWLATHGVPPAPALPPLRMCVPAGRGRPPYELIPSGAEIPVATPAGARDLWARLTYLYPTAGETALAWLRAHASALSGPRGGSSAVNDWEESENV